MKFNKRCLTAFSEENPYIAMGTKSKLFDTSFSLTSELFLCDYSTGVQYTPLQTDNKFYRLRWCENGEKAVLATGNEDGKVTLYAPTPEKDVSFEMLSSCSVLEGNVLGLDFNSSKNVLAAGSDNGKVIFWNLNKIDNQYTSDIPLTSNITCLSWNRKVSRILCAGTDDGKILILDIRAKNVAMTLGGEDMSMVTDVMWHPDGSTSILATTNQKRLQCFNLSSDSTLQIGNHNSGLIGLSMIDSNHVAASSKEQVDIIEIGENKVVESISVDGVFEVSFSKKDPLMAFSYVGGTTEVLSRATKDVLSFNSGCVVGDEIIGSCLYRIEDNKMEDVEEDRLMRKIKGLLYKNGSYVLNRKELGELLLEEEMDRMQERKTDEPNMKNLSMGMRFDLKDPLTLSLIRGDMNDSYEKSISSDKTVPFSLFLGLAKGEDSLSVDSDDILIHMSIAQLTSKFSSIIQKAAKDQWMTVISLISFSSLEDSEFVSNTLEMLDRVEDREKLVIYAITNKLDEYFELKTSMYKMPTSVYEVRDFFQSYKSVVTDLETMNGKCKSPVLSEYFWYAKAHGDEPIGIKYDDLGININLGRVSENMKIEQRMMKGEKRESARTSSIFESQKIVKEDFGNISSVKTGFGSPTTGGYGINQYSKAQGQTPNNVKLPPKVAQGEAASPGRYNPAYGNIPRPAAEVAPQIHRNITKPSSYESPPGSAPQRFTHPTIPGVPQKPHIPRPGTLKEMSSPPTYASVSKETSKGGYPSKNMFSAPLATSSYGGLPRDPKLLQDVPPKPHIPKPSLSTLKGSSGTYATSSTKFGNATTSQKLDDAASQTTRTPIQGDVPNQQAGVLNAEEILNTFEAIIQDLTNKASSKANLIIRNKLKEVTKRLSIYSSVSRDTFSAVILDGIDRINREIKNDKNSEDMKHNVREMIVKCADTGENRADLWMPSIYTLLQIVYH